MVVRHGRTLERRNVSDMEYVIYMTTKYMTIYILHSYFACHDHWKNWKLVWSISESFRLSSSLPRSKNRSIIIFLV